MEIVAHRPQAWFLAREFGSLFLDAVCSRPPASRSVLLRLTEEEAARFECEGEEFIDALAARIRLEGFVAAESRNLPRTWHDRLDAAARTWCASRNTPA